MKKFVALVIVSMLGILSVSAQNSWTIKLKDGRNMSVQACSDGIFRVKVSNTAQFSESLMERYGIVKTDWDKIQAKVSDNSSKWTVTTAKGKLEVRKSDGSVKLFDAEGKEVVGKLEVLNSKNPLVGRLATVINDKYASLHVVSNGGIIGDDDGTISEKDKAESGDPDKSSVIHVALKDGERFYGAGSTSREHIQHRGELLRIHTTYQHTEIPMPFMVSSNGWGIFNNTTRKNFFDCGSNEADWLSIYTPSTDTDFYLFLGGSMPAVIDQYTQVVGRSYVLPKWAYGLCFGPNMREDQWAILNDAVLFRQIDVPCDVFWLEPQWMETRYDFSTAKKFNSQIFSVEPYWVENKYPKQLHNRLFIGKLRSMGYHLGLWLCEEYDLTLPEEDAIAAAKGKAQSGEEHWMDHLGTFMDLGVEGFKLDPARTIDEHTYRKYYNGYTDKDMHNLNQVLLPKQMAQFGRKYNGKRTWHHYCGGWSGTQHWGASTSGDNGGGKTALFDQLNLGMSGFLNTSCDVMSVPRELEMASLHFGLFLPWTQINSWFSMMQPFYYDDREQGMYRDYVKLRYSLIPYIYSMALESSQNGMPIVRSMPLMFPEDRKCDDMVYQYMFGGSFLVGIFTDTVYLPEGNWIDYWTGEKIYSRGEDVTRQCPDNRAGLLFVKGGSIIPFQHDVKYIGNKPISNYILRVYPDGESSYTMYDSDAESYGYENGLIAATKFECNQSGSTVTLTINPVEGSFEDMPLTRCYDVEIDAVKPSKVLVNGNAVSDWTYGEDGKVRLSLCNVNVNQKQTITLQ